MKTDKTKYVLIVSDLGSSGENVHQINIQRGQSQDTVAYSKSEAVLSVVLGYLTPLPLGDLDAILKMECSILFYWLVNLQIFSR